MHAHKALDTHTTAFTTPCNTNADSLSFMHDVSNIKQTSYSTSHWCDAPDSDDSSAWNSGSRWRASISSGPTRRCSDRSEWADRFDRLDRVDLSLDRVDCRSIKFLLIVRRSSLLLDVVVVVIHGCFRACTAVNLTLASTTNNLSMKSRACTDTSFHACDTHNTLQLHKII